VYSGASTDVVAHEVGHAILDALRPDLWDSALPEHGAFHEAFGDCMAILTALEDDAVRQALLDKSPDLANANFVEATAEDLSDAVRRSIGAQHPAAQPRHALHKYRWQLPSTLPTVGGPSVLTGEVHSFARVFTGCFYDTLRNIFSSYSSKTTATLGNAARTAGALLVAGSRAALEKPRFFEEVGVAMLVADQANNAGANANAIRKAFDSHGITLGPPAQAFRERSRLAGGAAKGRRRGAIATVSPQAVASELRQRLSAEPGTRIDHSQITLGAERADKFVQRREVDLTGLGELVKGVVATAPEPIVVGGLQRGYAAARSSMPEPHTTEEEVRFFVKTLLAHGSIAPGSRERPSRRRMATAAVAPAELQLETPTHVVRTAQGKKVLRRVRFACGCG
jgi:hypothetical protein